MAIKNIIFDWGRVIANIDDGRTRAAFRHLGMQNPETVFTCEEQNQICDAFEVGKLSPDAFCDSLLQYTDQGTSLSDIHSAWSLMISDMPVEKIALLRRLKQNYQLFALSNTNAIHAPQINQRLQQDHQIEHINHLFDKVYFSFEMGLRKPDAVAYEHVLKDARLDPAETLFVDDLLKNVSGAKAVGMHGLHYPVGADLDRSLSDFFANIR